MDYGYALYGKINIWYVTLGCTCIHINEIWTTIVVALEDVKNCEANILNNLSVNITTFSNILNEFSDKFVGLSCCSVLVVVIIMVVVVLVLRCCFFPYQYWTTMNGLFHKQLFPNTYEYTVYNSVFRNRNGKQRNHHHIHKKRGQINERREEGRSESEMMK